MCGLLLQHFMGCLHAGRLLTFASMTWAFFSGPKGIGALMVIFFPQT